MTCCGFLDRAPITTRTTGIPDDMAYIDALKLSVAEWSEMVCLLISRRLRYDEGSD